MLPVLLPLRRASPWQLAIEATCFDMCLFGDVLTSSCQATSRKLHPQCNLSSDSPPPRARCQTCHFTESSDEFAKISSIQSAKIRQRKDTAICDMYDNCYLSPTDIQCHNSSPSVMLRNLLRQCTTTFFTVPFSLSLFGFCQFEQDEQLKPQLTTWCETMVQDWVSQTMEVGPVCNCWEWLLC